MFRYLPQHPNDPSGEQTSSPIFYILFAWMDPLIYQAWKEPHLPYDSLPPLCDYDRSAYLTEKSFPLLQVQGGKATHLGLKLLRTYGRCFPYLCWVVLRAHG